MILLSKQVDEAASEKHRLEEKQRHARKAREHKKEIWKPRYSCFENRKATNIFVFDIKSQDLERKETIKTKILYSFYNMPSVDQQADVGSI